MAYSEQYDEYLNDPTPENLHGVVRALSPGIDYALSSLGSTQDPVMRARAETLAAKAVKTYDPKHGAALHTWVSQQLTPLRRFRRESQSVVKIPERIHLDAYALSKAEAEFMDKYGRDPDVDELADVSGIPVKRQQQIRTTMRRTPSEGAIAGAIPTPQMDYSDEALDYLHKESDHIDRKILEMKTGYGGHELLEPKEIATRLKLSPVQLTRRSQRLAYKLSHMENMLQGVQSGG